MFDIRYDLKAPINHTTPTMIKPEMTDSHCKSAFSGRSQKNRAAACDVDIVNREAINKLDLRDAANLRFNVQCKVDFSSTLRYLRFDVRPSGLHTIEQSQRNANENSEFCSESFFFGVPTELLLASARERLRQTKEFAICVLAHEQKTNVLNLQTQSLIHEVSPVKRYLAKLGPGYDAMKALLKFSTKGKEESLAIQDHLDSLAEHDLMIIGKLAEQKIWSLIVDRYANYAIQKIAFLNKEFQQILVHICTKHFIKLAESEFASRVMQSLAEHSDEFRHFCHDQFKNRPKCLQSHISAVFLAASAIRSSKNQAEFIFYRQMLERKPRLLGCKYYKRIIVSYIEKCDNEELERMYRNLCIRGQVTKLLEDKYYAYIILMLVERDSPSMLSELKKEFSSNFAKTFKARFSGFLLTKMVERDNRKTLSFTHQLLISADVGAVHELGSSESFAILFIYTLLASANLKIGLSAKAASLLKSAVSCLTNPLA